MSDVSEGSVSSIGDRLRAAREAKKLSLDDLAAQTRIPIRHLKHIEDEEWDALPAPTYTVGFARSYANAVGLNGNEIGAELRDQIGAARPVYEPPQSYYEPADPARVPPKSLALIAGAIALALILGYVIWRSVTVGGEDVDAVEQAAAPQQQVVAPQPQQPQPVNATGPVILTATDEIWLRIYEGGTGANLFQGVMQAGQRYEVPATAQQPQIRTGRPQALRVTVGSTEIPPLGAPETTIDDVSLRAADLAARAQGGVGQQPQPGAAPGFTPGPQPAPAPGTVAPPAQPQ
ncbi:MAG TPA: helix-turn-helix domain-containing protein [Allosphingosinicella sp.]|uniref:helix-turn-helix domain-containing protein n=1 Tax=Allosphingosinicella sp. TaxID=2823234 RepID=UPI002EDB7E0A